ncbi:MAG: acetyl/propionyl/methylcrotonyl-CoA carboxylase subunit alpha [Aquabacterium sp.]|uniref:acetyl/propionyl/methylcrotonyl-CoA carboxylase subunit alpha n=1 Tax=Aquabacterium sp. TaxID=1872578 RepID=UPI001DDFB339|nr:acetyl/propionyl/methylcrotonyl-CoA carboxylase subunit alpha [Aquabacterium sp.]MBT9610161.1 acetyl/propionyl/methylcrotonyl-CoA carboxylase subunit alpha [Aquabacterium sp.]
MFTKILIANRGEIACRVAATAHRMGIRTVAVFSDADAHAQHVQACDEAVHIGGASPRDSYLRADRILAAALATGAQAVHPGYGFLSENDNFAQACVDAGIAFIGPPPSAIVAMGSKSAAKALMERAGVPLVPGYHGERQEPDFLRAQAEAIGFPVLIKASAGGGGKGMRIVQRSEDFTAALASCQREAEASFGCAQVLVERYLQRPRHIEVQVFADTLGQTLHLFERDCSVQRRHQKVLEEAPAPGMTPELRAQMGAAAVAAARSVGYVGAGTVEFICEAQGDTVGRFYFMEMNTRLQVEHPVTEAITGLDLVEWQLRVAAGEPLPLAQDQIPLRGHAIEARICAENPAQGFLPSTGTLRTLRTPQASRFTPGAVRLDSGVAAGDAISPHYDAMIAKLIVHGDTREAALARLDEALSALHITGLQHNVAFLRRLARTDAFAHAQLDTALIAREHEALFGAPQAHAQQQHLRDALLGATLRWWLDAAPSAAATSADPWSRRDGWALHGHSQRVLQWRWPQPGGDQTVTVQVQQARDGSLRLLWGDASVTVQGLQRPERHRLLGQVDGQPWSAHVDRSEASDASNASNAFDIFTSAGHTTLHWLDPLAAPSTQQAGSGQVTAPMPGKVIAVLVAAGDAVTAGQVLLITEAMKMEHSLTAPRDGTVAELLCGVGDQVAEGVELLRLE